MNDCVTKIITLHSAMNFKRNKYFLFCIGILLFSCKKENRGLSWNADYKLPLATTSITLNNFIADSLLENTDGKTGIIYKSTLYELDKSLLFNIPDTTVNYTYGLPFGSLTIYPGVEIFNVPQEVQLPTGQAGISRMIVESGKLNYSLTNKILQPVDIVYTIPSAIKNDVSLSLTVTVPAATNATIPGTISGFIDLSNYDIDLTGVAHNTVNKITSQTVITLDGSAQQTTINNSNSLTFSVTFEKLKPYYARGYFGQSTIDVGPTATNLDVFKNFKSGSFNLSKISCALDIENGIGVDAKLKIINLQTSNTISNTTKNLQHASINKNININRALDNPYQFSNYQLNIDETNSNIKDLIEILPNKLGYTMQVQMNPLGNISNGTDFIYSDRLFKANLLMRIPLNTKSNQLLLQDTISLGLNNDDKDFVNNGTLHFFVKNYFHNSIKVNLFTINSNGQLGEKISDDNIFEADFLVTNKLGVMNIPLTKTQIENLFASKKILIQVIIDSNNGFVEIENDSKIDVQISADFNKTVHLK